MTTTLTSPWSEITSTVLTSPWSEMVPVDGLSHWQIQALKGVLQTVHLPNNWDSYGSPPPSLVARNTAIELIMHFDFDDLPTPDVVPVVGGGIQFEWIVGQRELELEILPDGAVEFLKAEGGRPPEEGRLMAELGHLGSLLAWLTAA